MRATICTASLAGLLGLAALAGCGSDGDEPTPKPAPLPRVDASLLAYDSSRPLQVESERAFAREGFAAERLTYSGFGDRRVPALFAHAPGQRRGACIVYVLGVGLPEDAALTAAGPLAAADVGTLSIDTRAAARGEEVLRDPDLLARFLRETAIDLRRGLDVLEQQPECDPERLGYLGVSIGGIVGSLVAAVDRRVKAPIFIVSGADWRKILQGDNPLLPGIERNPARLRRALRTLAPFDPASWVPHISPRPVLIVNGRDDPVITVPAARALGAAARSPKRVVFYSGGHNDYLFRPRIATLLNDWIVQNVKEAD